MEANTQQDNVQRGRRRSLQGIVLGNGMDKTISVRVERVFKHPKYKKSALEVILTTAHDEENKANVGDTVNLVECRPLSKHKRWRMTDVVEEAIMDGGAL